MTASETHLLWAEFGDSLRRFIARRVANEADAEDILQEVFLRIHQRRNSVQRVDRLGAWLYQITRNAIIDYYRAPSRRRELAAGATYELADDQGDDAAHADAERESARAHLELASCLRPMVMRLPAHYREAISLVDLAGLTQRQAAEELGLSVSGMKSRVQRGRRVLKAMLYDCCHMHQDAAGRVVDYETRAGTEAPAAAHAAVRPAVARRSWPCGPLDAAATALSGNAMPIRAVLAGDTAVQMMARRRPAGV